jgi:hypothetical protein
VRESRVSDIGGMERLMKEMRTELIDSRSDTQGGVDFLHFVKFYKSNKSRYMFWYDNAFIASRLSRSAFLRKIEHEKEE